MAEEVKLLQESLNVVKTQLGLLKKHLVSWVAYTQLIPNNVTFSTRAQTSHRQQHMATTIIHIRDI